MSMRHFLILFDEIPIDASSIRAGINSPEVVTACRCVNVGLFISGNLRRDVSVSIAVGALHDLQIISFSGDTLRRVSPDERSISFFLFKALTISAKLPLNTSKIMENRIIIQRTGINELFESISPINVVIADANKQKRDSPNHENGDTLLFYDNRKIRSLSIPFELPDCRTVPRPPHPERFIFDINREIDSTQDDT